MLIVAPITKTIFAPAVISWSLVPMPTTPARQNVTALLEPDETVTVTLLPAAKNLFPLPVKLLTVFTTRIATAQPTMWESMAARLTPALRQSAPVSKRDSPFIFCMHGKFPRNSLAYG